MLRFLLLVPGLLVLAGLLAGCAAPMEQDSDWRWKQNNPNYRLPYTAPEGYR